MIKRGNNDYRTTVNPIIVEQRFVRNEHDCVWRFRIGSVTEEVPYFKNYY